MGKTRRRLTRPKFAKKYANLRAAIARRKGEVEPEPAPIVEEVAVVTKPVAVEPETVTIAVPEPVVEEPVVVKEAPKPKKKTTTRRRTTKKTATRRTTTKRTKTTTGKISSFTTPTTNYIRGDII